jgi:hypothetical protein
MNNTARSVLIVTATTGIGFIGNITSYSIKVPKAKGEKFGFLIPRGREMFFVLATGVVAGLLINKVLNLVENSLKTQEEKDLDNLVQKEKDKISQGIIVNKTPTQVLWV